MANMTHEQKTEAGLLKMMETSHNDIHARLVRIETTMDSMSHTIQKISGFMERLIRLEEREIEREHGEEEMKDEIKQIRHRLDELTAKISRWETARKIFIWVMSSLLMATAAIVPMFMASGN